MPTIHLRVSGRVQGVGFRWFVREHAQALQLAGWVRNTADGDVEIAASGDASLLEALQVAVSRGPAAARVERVVLELPPAGADLPWPFAVKGSRSEDGDP